MSLRLLNVSHGFDVTIYFVEIVSMSPSEKSDMERLRSSPVCGEMEYVNADNSVTVFRLRVICHQLLGERMLCYLNEKGLQERYLVFSRNAALIFNSGNLHSRTTSLLPIEGDPNKFLPENVNFNNSVMLPSLDEERILVVASQEPQMPLVADLMLSCYTRTQVKNSASSQYCLGLVDQPKEVLVIRTDTHARGLEALAKYLPYLGVWTWESRLWKHMAADKLTLLCPRVSREIESLVRDEGSPKGGYARFLDLRPKLGLEAFLYYGGMHNGINKVEIVGVAQLGLTHCNEIVERIFGHPRATRIYRVDWCVDVPDIPLLDLALYCRIPLAQNCSVERSRGGITFYLRRSKNKVLLVYDRIKRLRATGDPMANIYGKHDHLTRLEVQFRGAGVPFRRLLDIRRYAEIDLLPDLSFWKIPTKRQGLKPMQSLASEGLLNRIQQFGVQATSKMFPAQEWAYLTKKFLVQVPKEDFPDLNGLMRKSMLEWLNDRIRFPRLRKEKYHEGVWTIFGWLGSGRPVHELHTSL
jgi:hypothetical protein